MSTRKRVTIFIYFLSMLLIFVGISSFIINKTGKNRDIGVYNKLNSKTIHIEIDNKILYLVDNKSHSIVERYTIATGKPNSPTPVGTFKITNKGKWGEGFGSRWMGLDVPWGTYGIHGTNRPGTIGFNASAGCIRMRNSDIEDLYERVIEGTTVVITNGYYGPFGFGYRNLRPGASGADVLEVQKRLSMLGYYDGALDGIYGEGMKKSLVTFLNKNNMDLTDEISPEIYKSLNIILME